MKQANKYFVLLMLLGTTCSSVLAAEVNVYSYRQPYLMEPMFTAFTELTGIKVNTIFAKKGLIERIKNEGENSPADVLFTSDIGKLDAAIDAGISQSVESDILREAIPSQFRDPDGYWFGLSARARLIVSSLDRVEAGAIERYEDLTRAEFANKICTRSGKHDYMVALLASIIAHSGIDSAKSWLQGLKANLARKPQGNDRAQINAIAAGECDVAIVNSYYLGIMLSDPEQAPAAKTVRIVFPNQSDRGTHMNVSGMVMAQSSPNSAEAKALMEFMVGKGAQKLFADSNHEYPVDVSIERSDMVASWGDFEFDSISLDEIAKARASAFKMVDEVGYDF